MKYLRCFYYYSIIKNCLRIQYIFYDHAKVSLWRRMGGERQMMIHIIHYDTIYDTLQ